tara:strand:- start:1181 stop:1540 length:360 start_codon:yes stop_codon:yes gene_type:complete
MENCIKCDIKCHEKELDGDYLFMLCRNCISEYDVLTFKEFQETKKIINWEQWEKIYGFDDSLGNENFCVYGLDGDFGYIAISNHKNGKYWLNIGNWDGLTDDLEYFEKKLYSDHYMCEL